MPDSRTVLPAPKRLNLISVRAGALAPPTCERNRGKSRKKERPYIYPSKLLWQGVEVVYESEEHDHRHF